MLAEDHFDAALRLTERAAQALLAGKPHTAAQHYELAALLAESDDGARVLRLMAAEIRFGLLATANHLERH
jgi:hypothetical protein